MRFVIKGGVGYCNALRRSLLSDIETEAPYYVQVRTNTTCFTDEFLAHRIGLIPFRRVGNGNTMCLDVTGPGSIKSSSFVGPAFESMHDIDVAHLLEKHRLSLVVHFDRKRAATHARYSPCAAVGMRVRADGACELSFESNDARTPRELLLEALAHTEARLARALRALASQPETPPQSYC